MLQLGELHWHYSNHIFPDCCHFVAVKEEVSYRSQVQKLVPQISVLGLLLLTMYMLHLGDIIKNTELVFMVTQTTLSSIFL